MTARTRLLSIRLSEKLARYPIWAENLGRVEIKEQTLTSQAANTVNHIHMNNYKKEKTL